MLILLMLVAVSLLTRGTSLEVRGCICFGSGNPKAMTLGFPRKEKGDFSVSPDRTASGHINTPSQ